jgi:D-beta-D-heptose 7-phosphate kinase/D-beta-D-heptose 1-phosphate adenosyltransferase
MLHWLETLVGKRILVCGDVMLDRYWAGSAQRISPEAPVPIVRVRTQQERVGGAANVAANVAALGGSAALLGLTGDDPAADALMALCRESRIDARFVRQPQVTTTVKLRVLAQHQQLLRLDFEEGNDSRDIADLRSPFATLLATTDVVVFSDYAKGALRDVTALIGDAKAAGKPVIVDPKGQDFGRYAGADVITPNLHEFESVAGTCRDEEELVARAVELCRAHGLGAVLVTRGERGVSLTRSDGSALHLAAEARDVFDVTGAGDTVCASLACALAAGLDLEQAVAVANRAAGIVVGKLGTAVVTAAELATALTPNHGAPPMVVSREELLALVHTSRSRGERIVMTNGCFDVLHAGHVRYLEAAAALGERLIVAVNSDESVRRLKGAGRPLNPVESRMEVLGRLRAVDWVVAFEEDTPRALIAEVLPDVLVKGGDYQIGDIAGAQEVSAAGGRVLTLPYHEGFSSTRVIEAARMRETGSP